MGLTHRASRVAARLHARYLAAAAERERGDVPGWVMITLMTAVLVVIIWGLASNQLQALLTNAFDKVTNQSNSGN